MNDGFAVLLIDGFSQRNGHGADAHTVLRVTAVGNAVLTHDGLQSFIAGHLTRWVHIEESHLSNGLWANVVIAIVLWAGFKTATASLTPRVGVTLRHIFL